MQEKKKKLKMIIFDFDGTIADSMPKAIISENKIAKKYDYKKIIFNQRLKNETYFQILNKELTLKFYNPFSIYKFYSRFKKEFNKEIKSVNIFEGIEKVLFELKRKGYILGIISTNIIDEFIETLDFILEKNHIAYFDFIEHANTILRKKSYIKKILKKYNIKPPEAIYIGDEKGDILSSKKNNIKSIGVSWGFNSVNILEKAGANFIANEPKDILKIIDNIEKS